MSANTLKIMWIVSAVMAGVAIWLSFGWPGLGLYGLALIVNYVLLRRYRSHKTLLFVMLLAFGLWIGWPYVLELPRYIATFAWWAWTYPGPMFG